MIFIYLFFAIFLIGAVIAILYLLLFFAIPMIKGGPFVASSDEKVRAMMNLLDIKPGDKALDIGSGDGRIVIAMAKQGAEAHGIEINPLLVWWAKRKIKHSGLQGRAFVYQGNLWDWNYSQFDVVSLYGITYIMKGLEEKFDAELKPGSRVVSNAFMFPNWKSIGQEGVIRLYEKA